MINERFGRITASRYSNIVTGGKTRDSYLIDIVLDEIGMKKHFETYATNHGKHFEESAFNLAKTVFPNIVLQSNQYIPINGFCGASPDCVGFIGDDKIVLDLKCPQEDSFFYYKDINSLNSKNNNYYYQVQMQILATNAEYGILFFALFKPMQYFIDQSIYEDYTEEEISLNKKFYYHKIEKNEEIINKIVQNVADSQEELAMIRELLKDALKNNVSIQERMDFYEKGFLFRKFKDYSFRTIYKMKEKVYYFNEDFYVLKKIN